MRYPDEILPHLQLGIPDLVARAKAALDAGYSDDFVSLMVAGRATVDGEDHRLLVSGYQNVEPARLEDCTLTGDFDSLIGFTPRLELKVPLSVYPVPSFKHTLRTSVHATVLINGGHGDAPTLVPAHHLGNVCIATFGTRAQVRLLFPQIRAEGGTPKVTQTDLATLYDRGILRAIRELIPEHAAHWPPSYHAAMSLYRDPRGQMHYGRMDIPEDLVPDFATLLRAKLAQHPRLANPLFMIELRGTKGMFSFPFDNVDARQNAFNRLIEHIDLGVEAAHNNLPNWYCDVGVEVARPGHVLQWLSAAHQRLLAHALPSQTQAAITKLLGSTKFSSDVSGHLFDLAGFRANPGSRGRADHVAHVNVYTTDKSVTYQLHKGAFTAHRTTSLFPGPIGTLRNDLNTIAEVFAECGGSKGETQDGTARFEVRVAIEESLAALTTFPDALLRYSAVCIPNATWWDFKFYRVAGIHYIISELATDPPQSRALVPSLQLGAAMIYMLNAVISRPSDWRACKTLAEASAMRVLADDDLDSDDEADEDAETTPVGEGQGLFFLCDVMRDDEQGWWRLPASHTMDIRLLCSLYHAGSLGDIATAMGATGLKRTGKASNPARMQNRRGHTSPIQLVTAIAIPPLNLGLSALGLSIRQPVRLSGRDIEDLWAVPDPDALTPDTNLDDFISTLWAQFAYDLIQVSPNLKDRNELPYVTLSYEEQLEVTPQLFKAAVLPFRAVYYRPRDSQFWRQQFDRFFPPAGKVIDKSQNFPKCRYYHQWLELRSLMPAVDFNKVRLALWSQFRKLWWLPHTETTRIWDTRRPLQSQNAWKYLALDNLELPGPAVRIALNSTFNVEATLAQEPVDEDEDDMDDPRHMAPPPLPAAGLGRRVSDLNNLPPLRRLSSIPGQRASHASSVPASARLGHKRLRTPSPHLRDSDYAAENPRAQKMPRHAEWEQDDDEDVLDHPEAGEFGRHWTPQVQNQSVEDDVLDHPEAGEFGRHWTPQVSNQQAEEEEEEEEEGAEVTREAIEDDYERVTTRAHLFIDLREEEEEDEEN
ncbi:hypothetical protein ACG7TL_005168 [Trametes sanguinea]